MNDRFESLPRIKAAAGTPDAERIMDIVGVMLAGAASDQSRDAMDPARHAAMTMAAAGVLAGYLAGASIIAGTADDRDKRKMGEMLLTNFRQGVQVGKHQALAGLVEQGLGGRA